MPNTVVYKTVKIQPGEPFTLPPGATLVSTTDTESLTSSCDNLGDLEEMACYVFIVMCGDDDNSDTILGASNADSGSTGNRITGWRYNGTDYATLNLVPDGLGCFCVRDTILHPGGVDTLSAPLKAHADNSGIFIESIHSISLSGDGDDNGCHTFIVIKTLPSIAASLELISDTSASYVGDNVVPKWYYKPITYSAAQGLSIAGLPACS